VQCETEQAIIQIKSNMTLKTH